MNTINSLFLAFDIKSNLIGFSSNDEILMNNLKDIPIYFLNYIEFTNNEYIDIKNLEERSFFIKTIKNNNNHE